MSASSHSVGARSSATMLAERTRIVSALYDHADEMADAGMSAIVARIPAYAARDLSFRADVHDQLAQLCRTGLGALLERRKVTLDDVAYTRRAAARRAQAGLTLADYLNAFRLGQQALWQSLVTRAGESQAGREAALSMVTPLSRYCDLISTQAANAYLEFQQYFAAEASRDNARLMESLLDGVLPERGAALSLAQAHGIGLAKTAPMVVVDAVVLKAAGRGKGGIGSSDASDSQARHLAAAAIARTGVSGLRTLSVVLGSGVVAVAALGRTGTAEQLCDRLRATAQRLREEGITLGVGVSAVVTDVAEIPQAHQQARAALELLPNEGGIMALPCLTPLRYLMLRADETARQLVDPRIRALLRDDGVRGGVLAQTVRAFAGADMNLREAADALRIHHNTAKYRLRRIQELTGRNMRSVDDLMDLLVAIELHAADQ
ncbi:helix-turn-helix domain-containing protein [Nocardia abscessus]|uniref:PucR family transcriptional regulator n=1 Tax=Nocardia abscessus TaxID=120957 RepID=UPI0018936173|nr:helix-turn-helix domain-containing protein [Nocardia abscessus]MBF6336322.1 helix-turn-helix domain-containing protein [Nocardia abscessus]